MAVSLPSLAAVAGSFLLAVVSTARADDENHSPGFADTWAATDNLGRPVADNTRSRASILANKSAAPWT